MKTIDIQGRHFSKVICGTNPFYGHSHFSEARKTEYLQRFTDAYITETIELCLCKGVNTIESSANERIWRIISDFKSDLHYIGSTRIDNTSSMNSHQQKLNFLIEKNATVCVIHSQFVDRPRKQDDIHGLQRFIERIHEHDLLAGISTHRISTVELCEKKDYGVDLYLFPLNLSGFVYPGYDGNETVNDRVQIIQGISKPFVIMKSLAAGRIPPQDGLPFVLEQMKANDLITLGIGSLEEAAESIEIVEKYGQ